jgi:hypothetical protein
MGEIPLCITLLRQQPPPMMLLLLLLLLSLPLLLEEVGDCVEVCADGWLWRCGEMLGAFE